MTGLLNGLIRVQKLHPCMLKVSHIASNHRQTVAMGGGGELTVEGGKGDALSLPARHELTPNVGDAGIKAENPTIHALAEAREP